MIKNLTVFFLIFIASLCSQEPTYEFVGYHLLSSYLECDEQALKDLENLKKTMHQAVEFSGATLLDTTHHIFPPHGLTMVMLLSESHASIHTYPEHRACFVDFFTCGHHCSAAKFDKVLQEYLKPQKTFSRYIYRSETENKEIYK